MQSAGRRTSRALTRTRRRRAVAVGVVVAFAVAVTAALESGLGGAPRPAITTPVVKPPPIAPLIPGPASAIRWSNPEPWAGAPAPLLVASFPVDPSGDRTYVAWIRASRTELALYPGYAGPGPSALWRGPEMVPVSARSTLLSTFNSGFYEAAGPAGFYVNGRLYDPMVRGLATVIEYTNGTVDVAPWTGSARPGANIVVAHQNLGLLVNNGRITPAAAGLNVWGATLGGVAATWRSALGIDANGNLMYAAAPNQTAPSLARIMVHAGAVRAMELDINPAWPMLAIFGGPNAGAPRLFVQNPNQVATRFLSPSMRDFFAIYLRTTPRVTAVPF
jgi:Phosphodiester glycosidase